MTKSIVGLEIDAKTYCQLVTAIETLTGGLILARALYDVPETRRLGAIGALSAVTDFITEFKDLGAAGLHDPLLGLQMALADLDKGVRDPILEKAKSTGGRPRASSQRQMLTQCAGIAMEFFMRAGFDQKKAAAEVARSLRSAGFKLQSRGDKEITATTVKNFRDKASQGVPREDFDAGRYQRVLADATMQLKGRDAEAVARRLLDKMHELVKL